MKRPLAAFLLLLATSLSAQEPQPRFGETVDVNLVLLDVIVTDSSGNQILGLRKDDFVVKEKGREQELESVEYFTNRRLLNAREERAPFQVEQVNEERYFVFFFDKPVDSSSLFDRLHHARRGVRDFIDGAMQPGDRVAILAHDVRLKVYSDFTNDKVKLRKALGDAARFGRGLTTPPTGDEPSILRVAARDRLITGTGTVYEALESVGDALRPIRGRKNLIIFSPGIREEGELVRDGMIIGESRFYRPMIRALNRSNVTVYTMNLWGEPVNTPAVHQTLSRLAADTGGEYYRFAVTFGSTLKKIEQTNNGYYLLSYRARHPRGTRGWQRVDVAIRNQPQFRLKAREGYAFGE